VELPGIEPGPKIRLNSGNADLPTRNDAKRREMTCGYAEGVDGINTARPFTRTATAQQDTAAESALRLWQASASARNAFSSRKVGSAKQRASPYACGFS
jgi:hypothetical protein